MNGTAQNSQLTYFRAATVLIWAALPAVVFLYATTWNQLPARMATHFDFANQPNGWMSREGSFAFSVFFATLLAVMATGVLTRVKKPDATAWGLLALFYVVEGTLLWAENQTIAYSVQGTPVNPGPVLAIGIVAAAVLVFLALATRRGAELRTQNIFADETHSLPIFAAVLGLPASAFLFPIAKIPTVGLKLTLGISMLLMFAGAAMAGSGFHYVFSPAGIEIRTLGFRLRSVPAPEIKGYAVDRWNALGGYGIRGIGEKRAYVWSNRGVRIKTSQGEVFLGHADPEKIVRDLDLITNHPSTSLGASSGHESTPGS